MTRNHAKEFLVNLALDTRDYEWIDKIEKLNYDFTKDEEGIDVFETLNIYELQDSLGIKPIDFEDVLRKNRRNKSS